MQQFPVLLTFHWAPCNRGQRCAGRQLRHKINLLLSFRFRILDLTPSNLRLRRRLLVRLLLDLHQRGYSQLPGDQRFVGRRVDVFWMCSAHAQYLTPDRNKPTGDV